MWAPTEVYGQFYEVNSALILETEVIYDKRYRMIWNFAFATYYSIEFSGINM
jgi:hypothetical protein